MDSKARIMHGQLDCLVALAFIGLSGLCFSVVVVFIAMSTSLHSRTSGNCLDVLDRARTLLALLGCFCIGLMPVSRFDIARAWWHCTKPCTLTQVI